MRSPPLPVFGHVRLAGSRAIWQQKAGALTALMFGQPGLFTPRTWLDWFAPCNLVSYYDTSVLKGTLERLVDFNRINNAGDVRLSVGAVNVRTGQFSYFDSANMKIRPEHIMASGALPPGFPPIEIDGEHYWDGGLFSNTPLEYVLDYSPRRSRLTFQVDMFQAEGRLPTDLDEVAERKKDIRYSSRTQICSNAFRDRHEVRHAINELHKLLPPDLASTEQAKRLYEHGCVTEMDVVQLVYRPAEPQGASKDYDFSRSSMHRLWRQGAFAAETVLGRRHGSRRNQRIWACECSTCREPAKSTTRRTVATGSGGLPGLRILSRVRPATPSAMNCACHRHTTGLALPDRRMISAVPQASALARMILARQTCFCSALRLRQSPQANGDLPA